MAFWRSVLTMSAGVLAHAVALAGTASAGDSLQSILQTYLAQEELAGGILLVSTPDRREVVVAGIADSATGARVSPGSRFYVASVGKMAVATATLQLVDEGVLKLDAPILPLVGGVPDLPRLPNAGKARLQQLLDHSSGIPDYLTDTFSDAFHAKPKTLTPAFALPFAYGERATGRPGQAHEYSNSNYVLLGDIIATADATSLDAALRRRILDRAEMTDTTVGAKSGDHRLAHGYADLNDDGAEEDVSQYAWNSPLGDGPLVTTAADLEHFLFALFRDGKLLAPAMLRRMTAPSAQEEGYGLGVELGKDRWGKWYGHTGVDDGFEAEIRYYPDRKTALVFMTNGNSISDESIIDTVVTALFVGPKSGKKN
ncbi:serine hydrolase domain-containing protein [Magnetospirillum sulfuroxidans]|uniref:Beta-lactamase family protein n=1 Tax=Magnetospirillum sulfuroxidans TaxID=611300 RepID=A0ABS5I9Q9_9PROT|nr:serine hydrolase domain-containing protein [Magnetospirillum sulfuroxidans]MBR9971059.1 beta-lactamase family protein [Magnetospirillum sulfuroxidans]